jgi:hypothetical protein
MPAFGKLKIVAAAGLFAAAWIFFSTPGRRVLESLGVYTECAIDVWSLRKHCGARPEVAAERPPAPPGPSAPPRANEPLPNAATAQVPHPSPAAVPAPSPAPSIAPMHRALAPQAAIEASEVDRCAALWTTETHMGKSEWRSACMRLRPNGAIPATR